MADTEKQCARCGGNTTEGENQMTEIEQKQSWVAMNEQTLQEVYEQLNDLKAQLVAIREGEVDAQVQEIIDLLKGAEDDLEEVAHDHYGLDTSDGWRDGAASAQQDMMDAWD